MTGTDRYYGYGPISTVCTSVITTLFSPSPAPSSAVATGSSSVGAQHGYPSPPASASSSPQIGGPTTGSGRAAQWQAREGIDTPPHSPVISSDAKAVPDLMDFIAYALYRTRLPTSIVHSALFLLTRLKKLYPSARGTSSSPHRLFLSALMLASKMAMDDTYSNRSWCIVGQQLFTLAEVNRMERELFGFLNWNCCVTKEELDAWSATWLSGSAEKAAPPSSPRRKSSSSEERKRRRSSSVQESSTEDVARHRQATDAARALLRPVSVSGPTPSPSTATTVETVVAPPSPRSPSLSASASRSSSQDRQSATSANDPMHMRQSSASSMRSTVSSDGSSSQGSSRIPTSACGSSPGSHSSESPASLGPCTPEGLDEAIPAEDDSLHRKAWMASGAYEEEIEAY